MFKALEQICVPDDRHQLFSKPDGSPITFEHHHYDVAGINLPAGAPAKIQAIFDRARNAYLYSWFDYDLGGAAELLAFGALEQALKEYFGVDQMHRSGLATLYELAVRQGVFPVDPPAPALSTARLVASVRNEWAHGSDHIHDPTMVLHTLQLCADLIAALFPGTLAGGV